MVRSALLRAKRALLLALILLGSIEGGQDDADRLEALRRGCGGLCSTEVRDDAVFCDESRDDFFVACWLHKTVDCDGLWSNADIDALGTWPPPAWPPAEMEEAFALGGMRPVEMFGRGLLCGGPLCTETKEGQVPTQYLGKDAKDGVWSEAMLEEMVGDARRGVLEGTYGVTETNRWHLSFLKFIRWCQTTKPQLVKQGLAP
ncbi:hypothetical protein T484DRAFT_2474249 [Baffinella frigidus]|nr:hypothetical protein T484DRAFT_2474249 [Cryptophyta sp. CCMP2293]